MPPCITTRVAAEVVCDGVAAEFEAVAEEEEGCVELEPLVSASVPLRR